VTQLYSQALGSLSIASYDSRGYGGGIRTHLHAGGDPSFQHLSCVYRVVADRAVNSECRAHYGM
jgi:hypothetical protein